MPWTGCVYDLPEYKDHYGISHSTLLQVSFMRELNDQEGNAVLVGV